MRVPQKKTIVELQKTIKLKTIRLKKKKIVKNT